MTNDTNALLACPFCGELPIVLESKMYDEEMQEVVNGFSIRCMNKMCGMRPSTYPCREGNVRMFVHNWNQRAR